jgi:alkanesulfonate monooxygenase SsuD/methylene tetrahydromethanopterin reductase-like flavin-dependent oxidoreductase (luciferase family)
VKFIGLDLIADRPDETGHAAAPTDRLSEVIDNAVLFEDLGFDGFAVGERHHVPFLSSSPPVVLSHIAALTSRIRLFTGVTLLSVLDPVRVAEDYATLDHLSGGRVELIIGKGNGPEQAELFGIGRLEAWDTIAENYRLLRQIWSAEKVTWSPPEGVPSIRTSALKEAVVSPKPLQDPIRIWHGSATSERSVELAAEFGDPVFSAKGMNPVTRYAELVRHYRTRWAELGRDPAQALVGAGHGQTYVTRKSQDAKDAYRPAYERFAAMVANSGQLPGTRFRAGGQPGRGYRQGGDIPRGVRQHADLDRRPAGQPDAVSVRVEPGTVRRRSGPYPTPHHRRSPVASADRRHQAPRLGTHQPRRRINPDIASGIVVAACRRAPRSRRLYSRRKQFIA